MKLTERLFRAFTVVNFFAYLTKSNIVYTSTSMVCRSVSFPPRQHRGINKPAPPAPISTCIHCTHFVKSLQTSPAVGISFCLIIVRLSRILPEAQDGTRHLSGSGRTPASRTAGPDQVAVSFTQVKIQRDVFVSESENHPMETLDSQKEGYDVDSSDDSPRVFRSSLPPSALP